MKKIPNFLTLNILHLFIFLGSNAFSQVTVYDIPLDSIKKDVLESPEFFLELNKKCIHPDSVLYADDYFYLYYGSAYLDGFAPYGEGLETDLAFDFMNDDKNDEAIELCEKLVLSHPGYVTPFFILGIAYDRKGDTTKSKKFFERFYEYLAVPYFTGNGSSTDSAFIVRSIDDEYLIAGELGFDVESQALIFDKKVPYDILYVKTESDTVSQEMYFNILQPYTLGLNFGNAEEKETKKDKKKKKSKRKKK